MITKFEPKEGLKIKIIGRNIIRHHFAILATEIFIFGPPFLIPPPPLTPVYGRKEG
jgi:hypothetical protein